MASRILSITSSGCEADIMVGIVAFGTRTHVSPDKEQMMAELCYYTMVYSAISGTLLYQCRNNNQQFSFDSTPDMQIMFRKLIIRQCIQLSVGPYYTSVGTITSCSVLIVHHEDIQIMLTLLHCILSTYIVCTLCFHKGCHKSSTRVASILFRNSQFSCGSKS